DNGCLVSQQRLEVIWQSVPRGQARARDQNRYDLDAAAERSHDLGAHPIMRVIQATFARLVARLEPFRTDDGEQPGAHGETVVEHVGEILARPDAIDINEHVAGAEPALEVLRNAQRMRRAVVAPVIDEDLASHGLMAPQWLSSRV